MTLKSLIPVRSERGLTRSISNPFSALQQEIDRLFDGFSRNFTGFPSHEVMPSMDLSETDKEIEITAELPGLEEKDIQLTFSTPFDMTALMPSAFTPSGNWTARVNDP